MHNYACLLNYGQLKIDPALNRIIRCLRVPEVYTLMWVLVLLLLVMVGSVQKPCIWLEHSYHNIICWIHINSRPDTHQVLENKTSIFVKVIQVKRNRHSTQTHCCFGHDPNSWFRWRGHVIYIIKCTKLGKLLNRGVFFQTYLRTGYFHIKSLLPM